MGNKTCTDNVKDEANNYCLFIHKNNMHAEILSHYNDTIKYLRTLVYFCDEYR